MRQVRRALLGNHQQEIDCQQVDKQTVAAALTQWHDNLPNIPYPEDCRITRRPEHNKRDAPDDSPRHALR